MAINILADRNASNAKPTVIALAATPDDERRSELGSGGKRSRNILTV
jgi:hypothetical protein